MASVATTSEIFKLVSGEKLAALYQMSKPRLVRRTPQNDDTAGMNCLQALKQPAILPVSCCLLLIDIVPEMHC